MPQFYVMEIWCFDPEALFMLMLIQFLLLFFEIWGGFLQHWLKKHFAQHLIKREDFHKTLTACECGRVNMS